jgi:hypothetical protein
VEEAIPAGFDRLFPEWDPVWFMITPDNKIIAFCPCQADIEIDSQNKDADKR